MKVKDSRLKKTSTDNKSSQLVPLWAATVRRVRQPQTLKRRPLVRNKDGAVVWRADPDKFYYRDESTGKLCSCSCSIDGGVVIIRDHSDEVVEAYKLKDGETVETE
jgi:hypothetical protein